MLVIIFATLVSRYLNFLNKAKGCIGARDPCEILNVPLGAQKSMLRAR